MSVEIVPINASHVASLRAGLDEVARERKFLAQVEAPPIEAVREFVTKSISNDVAHFVAVDDSRVVGWCDIMPAWAHAVQHRGTLGLGVLREYRGKGIGKRLLAACLAKAQSKGITRVQLEVRADNAAAIALYKQFNFVTEATLRQAMRIDGQYFDALQMSLIWMAPE